VDRFRFSGIPEMSGRKGVCEEGEFLRRGVLIAIIVAVNHAAAGLGETTAHSLARIIKS
jgi:hypothetical protein